MRLMAFLFMTAILGAQQRDAAIGAQMAQEIRARTTALDSASAQRYVEDLGSKLSMQSPGLALTFSLIKSGPNGEAHEPIVLPGGYIFVPANLFLDARNEGEFAGILAHAIAHAAARDGVRFGAAAGTIPLVFVIPPPWNLLPGRMKQVAAEREIEADRLAAQSMAAGGYDPQALLEYVDRVYASTPGHDARVASLKDAIRDLPAATYAHIQAETRSLIQPRRVPSLLSH